MLNEVLQLKWCMLRQIFHKFFNFYTYDDTNKLKKYSSIIIVISNNNLNNISNLFLLLRI